VIRPEWEVPRNVHAAFTLRSGGVSAPPFDTLNVGEHVGDSPADVAENRRRVREALDLPSEPAWLDQVHGARVLDLDEPAGRTARLSPADAVITRERGRVCAIQVADCMPVLIAHRSGKVVAAAHAGWRGLAGGVLEATVNAFGCDGGELRAWLGPAISQVHFEVGDEVRAAFVSSDGQGCDAFLQNNRGRWQCDLYALARRKLEKLGIESIAGAEHCTFADPSRFFSHRRDGRCGRMTALLWMS
jgi:polyphenol oxidase